MLQFILHLLHSDLKKIIHFTSSIWLQIPREYCISVPTPHRALPVASDQVVLQETLKELNLHIWREREEQQLFALHCNNREWTTGMVQRQRREKDVAL